MDTRKRIIWGVGAALGIAGTVVATTRQADAGTATANLSVSATVANNCTISTTSVAFGSYDPVVTNAAAALDNTGGKVTIACTKGAAPTIALDLGTHSSAGARRLNAGGTDMLTYELYHDSLGGTVWGTSGANLKTTTAAPSKAARDYTVFARIAGGQDVAAGTYTDTVVATVNF